MFSYFDHSSSVIESNNLLEDLHIPDSRLIDGDAAELALIGKNLIRIVFFTSYISFH